MKMRSILKFGFLTTLISFSSTFSAHAYDNEIDLAFVGPPGQAASISLIKLGDYLKTLGFKTKTHFNVNTWPGQKT